MSLFFMDDDQAGYYGYDGNGERVYKLMGYVHKESYNAGEETTKVMLNDVVLYVNPYFIVTPKGYTKHYYNGGERLASVVGDLNNLPDSIATGVAGGSPAVSAGGMGGSPAQNSGRLKKRTDLTGSITYQYDELGNIRQEDRHIILPNEEKTYNFTTRYNYDMLGRMTEIIYPDSEVVDYTYQLGQLTTIQGDNQTLAQEMKYDEYDHLTQMKHGNGYTTSYNYDTNRQWLKNSRTSNIYTSIGKRSILRDASYSYDRVGNIVAIQEYSEAYQPDGKTAITIPQIERDFSYDANNRLIHSSSTQQLVYGGGLMLPVYDYNITYSPSGMIASKTTTLNGVKTDLRYGYNVPLLRGQGGGTGFEGVSPSTDTVRNHQIRTITSGEDTTKLCWDADGQLSTMRRVDSSGYVKGSRTHLWNENGQLAMFLSDDQAGYYGYDGNGERVYKLTGYVHKESYNAGDEMTHAYMNDVVLYVNPYFIVTPRGYTKHYYNGSQRLASKIGNIENLPDGMIDSASNSGAKDYLANLSDLPNADTSKRMHVVAHCEENMLLPVLSKQVAQSDFSDAVYYYHGDHLGSATWITDKEGQPVEYISYLPYGELLHRKRFDVSNYVERYTFTGKEKDEESGYYYFGARYLDAMLLTSWLSIDRKAKANESPYLYCSGNPLIIKDPDGNFGVPIHRNIIANTFASSNLSAQNKSDLSVGTGFRADYTNMFNGCVHMDNMKGTISITNAYNNAMGRFSIAMSEGDYETAGLFLHTICDFYAHSNYIELYKEYAKANGLSLDIGDIPTFSEAMQNPDIMSFFEENDGLKTGEFNVFTDFFSSDPNSHNMMNKDSNKSFKGSQKYDDNKNSSGNTLFDAAKNTAQKEVNKLAGKEQ